MELSVLEQSPRLSTIYTQLCFCFGWNDAISKTEVIETLNAGLERLTAALPWVAGQVVNEEAGEGNTGVFRVRPWRNQPLLVVKDYADNDSLPSMAALREARFPYSMLDENVICPRSTLSGNPGETTSDVTPVLLLQANFIEGGLLLTVNACHSTMDIVGQGQIICLLDKACKGEDFNEDDMQYGNLDRRNLIPLLDTTTTSDPKPQPEAKDKSHDPPAALASAEYCWAYFLFSADVLVALKAHVSSSNSQATGFISTDDALCALLWKFIGRARISRLEPSSESVFTRAVDGRRFFGVSEKYMGNLATKTKHILSLQNLADESLGVIASQLRSALEPDKLRHEIQSLATVQSQTKDKSTQQARDRSKFIVMSSWTKVDNSSVDFGLKLGPPQAVRRPRFSPLEGVVYLLPKGLNGEIVAGLCLRGDDMERLRSDREFLQYGEYIG